MALLAALAVLLGAAATSDARGPSPPSEQERREFLNHAEVGVKRARQLWWNHNLGWYDERLNNNWNRSMPLVRLWSAYPLFEALTAIALAEPTPAHKAAVRSFAAKARRYWNPELHPIGGFAYYIDTKNPRIRAYYDDNGWWGIAFLDAYRATGDRSFLRDARRAFRFIVLSGWDDAGGGGIWWETWHKHKTAEPLAAAAYIGAVLYGITRERSYLDQVTKLIAWADTRTWDARRRLYRRSDTSDVVMNYVQGMMIGAHLELCRVLEQPAYCAKAQALGRASLLAFPADAAWTPIADGIYLRHLLDLYRYDRDPRWYGIALRNARRALRNSRGRSGLFLKDWAGRPVPGDLLRTHASSVALFAWLATVAPPSRE